MDLIALSAIEGVGTKMVKVLYKKFGIGAVNQLERAIKQGKVAKLPRFGQKMAENILASMQFLATDSGRFVLGAIYPEIQKILDYLHDIPGVERVEAAGSVRRMRE